MSAKMAMEATAGGKTVTARGEGVFGPGEFRESMTVTADGQTIEMRMIGDALYVKLPPARELDAIEQHTANAPDMLACADGPGPCP